MLQKHKTPAPEAGVGERSTPMTNITTDPQIANKSEVRTELLSRMEQVLRPLDDEIRDGGLTELMANALAEDPRDAELAVRDLIFGKMRHLLGRSFERLDDHGRSVEVDGVLHHRAEPTAARLMTVFGPTEYRRSRYRPSGLGPSVVPTEAVLGIGDVGMTAAAEEMSLLLTSSLTHRDSEEMWQRLTGAGPSASSLTRLTVQTERCWSGIEEEELEAMREWETIPDAACSILVCLDGVMVSMLDELEGNVLRPAGWREASTGAVLLLDGDGGVLSSRYFGRLPEQGKQGLKRLLTAEVMHLQKRRPDLRLVAAADAAPDNWTWLDKLDPDRSLVDFWHGCQHLKECADDAFGKDSEDGRKWFDKHRRILRDDAKGIGRTIDAIRYLVRKERGGKVLRRELEFFRKNRARMDYRGAKDAGCPIGSGCVESSNKFLVQQRMKRSGQRWGREGGQGVLTFRSLLKSGRFDGACRSMVRRRRAKVPVRLPASAPKLALAA